MNLFETQPQIITRSGHAICGICGRMAANHVEYFCPTCNKPRKQVTQHPISAEFVEEEWKKGIFDVGPYSEASQLTDNKDPNALTFEYMDYYHVIRYMDQRVNAIRETLRPFFKRYTQGRNNIHAYIDLDYYVGKNFIYTSDHSGSQAAEEDRIRKKCLAIIREEFDLPSTYMFYFNDVSF